VRGSSTVFVPSGTSVSPEVFALCLVHGILAPFSFPTVCLCISFGSRFEIQPSARLYFSPSSLVHPDVDS